MIEQQEHLHTTNRALLFLMLLSPLLAYVYTVYLMLPKTITVFYTFLFFAYGIVFIMFNKQKRALPFARYALYFAIYYLGWNYFIETERHILTEIYDSIKFFTIFFVVLLIYNTTFSEIFIKRSIIIIKITIIIAAAASIIQVFNPAFLDARFYFREDYNISLDLYSFRRGSIFGFVSVHALGLAFIPLLSVLIGYLLYNKNRYYLFYLILGGGVAFLSNTRYIMVGFLLLTTQILFANKVRLDGVLKYLITIAFGLMILWQILQYLDYDMKEWYEGRLLHEGALTETTRYRAIDNFLKFFPQSPVFGTGTLTEEIRAASRAVGSSHIHVGYLSHLVYYGIVGCFFLYGFWFMLVKKLYQTAKSTNYWGSYFAFLIFLWSFATMSEPSIFHYGLIFALVFDKYFEGKQIELEYTNNEQ